MHNRDTNTLTPLGVEWVRRKNHGVIKRESRRAL
jgi:hypothetical protein